LTFTEFGFDPCLLDGIAALGYQSATPIQELAIPVILKGKDLIGSAQTGTGKTAAFLLPIIHKIITEKQEGLIKALVIVPTRELAVQIDQHMEGLSYYTPVSSVAVYGGTDGSSFSREKMALTQGAGVVICTPGRMIAHLNMGYVDFSGLDFLILDEADRMLDMGFYDDIEKIISYLPPQRQTLMFSATMPEEIRELAKKILKNPEEISIALAKPAERILQLAYVIYDTQKIPLVTYLLQNQRGRSILIFCSTKSKTRELSASLRKAGLDAGDISSDLDQSSREKVLMEFKSRNRNILVATDVLSRGIDIEDIDMVINFDVPHDAEDYIHRIGRTARAAASGVAITLINEKDQSRFRDIEKLLGKPVHKGVVPVHLGEPPVYREYQTKKSYRKHDERIFKKKNTNNS
jgi:superfamily II DNA/RNA helicase